MIEVDLDDMPALEAADRLSGLPGFAFLDSAGGHGEAGRYSFIGLDPFGTFHVRGGTAFWNGAALPGAPLAELRACLGRYRLERMSGVPFRGGAMGYIAYDFARRLERLALPAEPDDALDEMRFGFYDLVLAFDRRTRRARLFSSGFSETDPQARLERAKARAGDVQAWLTAGRAAGGEGRRACGEWHSNFSAAGYEAAVERVKAYILAGDIYQANIAQRFTAALPEGFDAWAFYRTLRTVNPAPFAAFLRSGAVAVASSSPERFLKCADGHVEARPIKGTARRDADPVCDAEAAAALVRSEKDRAENTMIVDLLRNDLSRVAQPGSVEVPTLCGLESYEGLHHLTSVVTARLRPGRDAVDLLEASFPGGSITGAPKLRAMDIITEIERIGRGLYCGAIGHIGFDGDLDLNIAIRTVVLEPRQAHFSVGGGITLLSEPKAEHAETLVKASRIFAAFRRHAEGGG